MPEMQEIRWHGRGGQGVKTAATFMAETAMHQGKYSQGFPDYGPERMGAPVRGYTRISDQPIRVHTEIDEPDAVVVIDSSLISQEIIQGIKSGGDALINSQFPPEYFKDILPPGDYNLYVVNATQIAIDEIGRAIPNTPMMGALIKVTGILDIDNVCADITQKFKKKFDDRIVQGNIKAIRRAYEEVKKR
jgi:pyruvate ferredoxin oxidoreductase gamma subunit